MMHTAQSYARQWATLTHTTPAAVYVPEALRSPESLTLEVPVERDEDALDDSLRRFADAIREDGHRSGIWYLPGEGNHFPDSLTVSLARFQSYRGRTRAALIEELSDFAKGAPSILFRTESGMVYLGV